MSNPFFMCVNFCGGEEGKRRKGEKPRSNIARHPEKFLKEICSARQLAESQSEISMRVKWTKTIESIAIEQSHPAQSGSNSKIYRFRNSSKMKVSLARMTCRILFWDHSTGIWKGRILGMKSSWLISRVINRLSVEALPPDRNGWVALSSTYYQ